MLQALVRRDELLLAFRIVEPTDTEASEVGGVGIGEREKEEVDGEEGVGRCRRRKSFG